MAGECLRPLRPEDILPHLTCPEIRLELHPVLGSTNDRARELALAGAPALTLVSAEAQTAGRGRQGRRFFSPAGTGVYMSLLLRPESLAQPGRITTAAAVAAARALEAASGRAAQIKWVNDVYVDGRKAVGILTEAGQMPDGSSWAVLGVGVNLLPPASGFPAALRDTATAVLPGGDTPARGRLIAAFLNEFLALWPGGEAEVLGAYRARDFLRGRQICAVLSGGETLGVADGIDEDLCLRLRLSDGRIRRLAAGEVHIRPAAGENSL